MSNIGPNILETKNLQQYYSGSKTGLFIIFLFTVHFYGYETSMHPYQVVKIPNVEICNAKNNVFSDKRRE